MSQRNPQGGVHADLIGDMVKTNRIRVWVESINSLKATALIRYIEPGMRSRCFKVPLARLDFGGVPGWQISAATQREMERMDKARTINAQRIRLQVI